MKKSPSRWIQLCVLAAFFIAFGAWIGVMVTGPSLGRLPVIGPAPFFSLLNEKNQHFSSNQLQGRVWVADFITTQGQGTSPVLTSEMSQLQKEFQNKTNFRLITFTVNPHHDTPAILDQYSKKCDANLKKWFFLTGSAKQIYKIAQNGFKVAAAVDSQASKKCFVHSSSFILVDSQGRIRGYYDACIKKNFEFLKQDLKRLLN